MRGRPRARARPGSAPAGRHTLAAVGSTPARTSAITRVATPGVTPAEHRRLGTRPSQPPRPRRQREQPQRHDGHRHRRRDGDEVAPVDRRWQVEGAADVQRALAGDGAHPLRPPRQCLGGRADDVLLLAHPFRPGQYGSIRSDPRGERRARLRFDLRACGAGRRPRRHQLGRDRLALGIGGGGGERAGKPRGRAPSSIRTTTVFAGHVAQTAAVLRDDRADPARRCRRTAGSRRSGPCCARPTPAGRCGSPVAQHAQPQGGLSGRRTVPQPLEQQEVRDRSQRDAADGDRERERAAIVPAATKIPVRMAMTIRTSIACASMRLPTPASS